MKKQMLALAMMVATSVAAAPWEAQGPMAIKYSGHRAGVAVVFRATGVGACDDVALVLLGNSDIKEASFCTDQQCFKKRPIAGSVGIEGTPNVFFMINTSAMNALLHDSIAEFKTDQGDITVTLVGFRSAILEAFNRCMEQSRPAAAPGSIDP